MCEIIRRYLNLIFGKDKLKDCNKVINSRGLLCKYKFRFFRNINKCIY